MLSTFSGSMWMGSWWLDSVFSTVSSGKVVEMLIPWRLKRKCRSFLIAKAKKTNLLRSILSISMFFFRRNTFKNLIDSDFYHEHLFVKPILGCCLWAHVGPQGTIFGAASFGQQKGATSHVSSQFHALLSAPSLKPMLYQHFKFWAKNEALMQTPTAETSFNQHKSISNFVAFASFPATFELLLHGPWMAPYMALRNALYVGGGSLATALLRAGTAVPNHLMWPSAVGLGEGIYWGPVTLEWPQKTEIACRYGLLHGAFLSRRRFGHGGGRFSSLTGRMCVLVWITGIQNQIVFGWFQTLAYFILFPSYLGWW